MRRLLYSDAVREALETALAEDDRVYVIGLGATDPKAIFGTTAGLEERFGSERVLDMPCAENGMTGVAIGSALTGSRPVMIHQRADFALLALDQLANTAAKWNYIFDGRQSVPLTVRMIIGRGWGQGPQHSQSLQATLGHFPGLKVVMPATPHDAKGMLLAAIDNPDPVVVLEHRWLHGTFGDVPSDAYRVPLGRAAIVRSGGDVTIAATSFGLIDALRAADVLAEHGVRAEVIDLRSVRPLDVDTVAGSVRRTGRFVAVDHGWKTLGLGGELIASVVERCYGDLQAAPRRVCAPDTYVATAASQADEFYPDALAIVNAAFATLGRMDLDRAAAGLAFPEHRDVPDPAFRGPF